MDHSPEREGGRIVEDGRPPDRVEAFVSLLGQHQRRIAMYVMSLVPHETDAEEIIQETNLVLWREFDRFEPGTSFAAWACRIALNRMLALRKRQRRHRLEFGVEFLEALTETAIDEVERLEERSKLLGRCLEKLPERQRAMLRLRYLEGHDVPTIARELCRSTDAVYRALSRIRRTLRDCVGRSATQRSPV
jgi:RNA polymerase sigma-70 factor (ECF subfamily)